MSAAWDMDRCLADLPSEQVPSEQVAARLPWHASDCGPAPLTACLCLAACTLRAAKGSLVFTSRGLEHKGDAETDAAALAAATSPAAQRLNERITKMLTSIEKELDKVRPGQRVWGSGFG